jgi:hypothetical protein
MAIVRIATVSAAAGSLDIYRLAPRSISEVIPDATSRERSAKSESTIAYWADLNLGTQLGHSCPIYKMRY